MITRPITFTAEQVTATLSGRMTLFLEPLMPVMTPPFVPPRDVILWLNEDVHQKINKDDGLPMWVGFHPNYPHEAKWFTCPYGQSDDLLWVREDWAADYELNENGRGVNYFPWFYRANDSHPFAPPYDTWNDASTMPREASRLTLRITTVDVVRLQEIGDSRGMRTGLPLPDDPPRNFRRSVQDWWDAQYKAKGLGVDTDPWTWLITFEMEPEVEP